MCAELLSQEDTERLGDNLASVRKRVVLACQGAGRDPNEVQLVAVTKYAGVSFARTLLRLGQVDLGENRIDHLRLLAEALSTEKPAPRWHMVGHLQRNKAKSAVAHLHSLHSLDSLQLARRLQELRPDTLPPLQAYAQVQLGPGEAHSGVEPGKLNAFIAQLSDLTKIRVIGLMGLPPLASPEEARPQFTLLRQLLARIPAETRQMLGAAKLGLSMGMTSDLEVAIQEGATCVRVGRALLEGLSPAAHT